LRFVNNVLNEHAMLCSKALTIHDCDGDHKLNNNPLKTELRNIGSDSVCCVFFLCLLHIVCSCYGRIFTVPTNSNFTTAAVPNLRRPTKWFIRSQYC